MLIYFYCHYFIYSMLSCNIYYNEIGIAENLINFSLKLISTYVYFNNIDGNRNVYLIIKSWIKKEKLLAVFFLYLKKNMMKMSRDSDVFIY